MQLWETGMKMSVKFKFMTLPKNLALDTQLVNDLERRKGREGDGRGGRGGREGKERGGGKTPYVSIRV